MGSYLNPGSERFQEAVNSKIYVDKTGLISYTNSVLHTKQKYICASRPRRFGKSTTADMLAAYYSRGCDARELFKGLNIARNKNFESYRNKYDTVFLNMQEFVSQSRDIGEMTALIEKTVLWDLLAVYPDFRYFDNTNLARTMQDIYQNTKRPFVVIIDEWDCVFREYKEDKAAQEKYLDFLRNLLKDKGYLSLIYMTGILPIKKYGTHSALNMFDEFSMLNPGALAEYTGFTQSEVDALCRQYHMDGHEIRDWYNGYRFEGAPAIYNPRSVVSSILFGRYEDYWNQTETFEALRLYIDLNFDGLKDSVLRMIAGEEIPVNARSFANDMTTFRSGDDVLTLLVHLGYLGYDSVNKSVFIPNQEIRGEFVSAVASSDWGEASVALKNSADTLSAIWNRKPDLVFIPKKKFPDKPALVIELKWNQSAEGAIAQIRNRRYCDSLKDYRGNLLLVGINYDKKTREHTCQIVGDRKER